MGNYKALGSYKRFYFDYFSIILFALFSKFKCHGSISIVHALIAFVKKEYCVQL